MNKIISLITAFKKFEGTYDKIQRSAIYSWIANDLHVIAPANESDTIKVCSEYPNITIVDGVKRGCELGFNNQSPILQSLIEKALPVITTPMVAYLNSDIILLDDFSQKINKAFEIYGSDIFVVGSRNNINLNYYVNNPESYKKVHQEPRRYHDLHTSSDIFITSRSTWEKIIKEMPEFILGRFCWDNWLQLYAELNKLKKYNCTTSLITLHCNHDYEHIKVTEPSTNWEAREAPSSHYNFNLWKPITDVYGRISVDCWKPFII